MVDGKLKIDIPLSKDFVGTYQAMEKVRGCFLLLDLR
jgi:hypothetical protein